MMYKVFENDDNVVGQIAEFPSGPEGLEDAIDHAKWYEKDNLIPAFVMDTNKPDDPVVYGNQFHNSIPDTNPTPVTLHLTQEQANFLQAGLQIEVESAQEEINDRSGPIEYNLKLIRLTQPIIDQLK